MWEKVRETGLAFLLIASTRRQKEETIVSLSGKRLVSVQDGVWTDRKLEVLTCVSCGCLCPVSVCAYVGRCVCVCRYGYILEQKISVMVKKKKKKVGCDYAVILHFKMQSLTSTVPVCLVYKLQRCLCCAITASPLLSR